MGTISDKTDKLRNLFGAVSLAGQFAKRIAIVITGCLIVIAGCLMWIGTLFTMFVLGYRG